MSSNRIKHIILFIVVVFQIGELEGQIPGPDELKQVFRIHAKQTIDTIVMDGKVDEQTWQMAEIGTDFWLKLPYFSKEANPKTEVRLAQDDRFLYVSAICYQTEKLILQTLKRDEYWDNDGIAMMLDPLNSKTNAFIFGISAAGAQFDAQRSQTDEDLNRNWNERWYSATYRTDEFWSMEMAIPFRILRFEEGRKEWGLNFVRNIQFKNEYHNWTAVPESFWPIDPAFGGTLILEYAPEISGKKFNLIPYATAGVYKTEETGSSFRYNVGMDAKLAVSPSLNLDLTLNPDFSQVEADELITNLTRFDIALPEKRNFFLENSDIFGGFGFRFARPFFSRTIGLDEDRNPVPILYGARLTGNITEKTRIGFMNIHSLNNEKSPGQNHSAISFQRRFGRSFIQGLFLNRQAFDKADWIRENYGRNLSLEGAYISDNGRTQTWLGLHQSYKSGYQDKRGFFNFGGMYTTANWEIQTDFVSLQENYFADMGFIARIENYDAERDTTIRLGFSHSFSKAEYKYRPRGGQIASHIFAGENFIVINDDFSFNERVNELSYTLTSRSGHILTAKMSSYSSKLSFPFSFTDDIPLPAELYHYNDLQLSYNSDIRKALSVKLEFRGGGFYNGSIRSLNGSLNYRVQPWGNFGLEYQWNELKFPDPFGNTTIGAMISKIEIGFSKDILWTTLLQYVDQSDYVGLNSRLLWRFAPMSEFYLVYLDNYDVFDGMGVSNIQNNNRALVAKISYWY